MADPRPSVPPAWTSVVRDPSLWGRWKVVAVAFLLLASFDQFARRFGSRYGVPGGSAAWIWAADSPRETAPRAFYLVKDFTLDELPSEARLLVGGDGEYLLFLNGFQVGANSYRPGAVLDFYQVARLLTPGGNRLLAEVRSSQGIGGFLLHLDSGESGETLAETDGTWKLLRESPPGVSSGWKTLGETEAPRVWGRPPIARWGSPVPGPERPLFPPPDRTVRAIPAASVRPLPGRAEADGAPASRYRPTLYEWNGEVEGYLRVQFRQPSPEPALLFASLNVPLPSAQAASALVVLPTGAQTWNDSQLRRLRYVELLTASEVTTVEIVPVEPGLRSRLAAPLTASRGVFGIRSPTRLMPLEIEIRQSLGERTSHGS